MLTSCNDDPRNHSPVSVAVLSVCAGVALLEAEWDAFAEEDAVAVGVQAATEEPRLAKDVPSFALQSSSWLFSHFHDDAGYFSLNASSALP